MRLSWPNCTNVRDLGGLRVGERSITRHGSLIRADNLDQLTATGVAAVEAVAPSLILDVRAGWEAELFVSPFAAAPVYRNLPVGVDGEADAATVLEDYLLMLERGRDRIVTAVRAVADAPPGLVLVHCHAGRDRTGIVIALILSAVGVSPWDVAEDYARSSLTDPQVMLDLLEHLTRAHRGAVRYLLGGGLRRAQLKALSQRIVADIPDGLAKC